MPIPRRSGSERHDFVNWKKVGRLPDERLCLNYLAAIWNCIDYTAFRDEKTRRTLDWVDGDKADDDLGAANQRGDKGNYILVIEFLRKLEAFPAILVPESQGDYAAASVRRKANTTNETSSNTFIVQPAIPWNSDRHDIFQGWNPKIFRRNLRENDEIKSIGSRICRTNKSA